MSMGLISCALGVVLAVQASSMQPQAEDEAATKKGRQVEIQRSGSQPSNKGPAEWFTGSVRIDPLFDAKPPARASAATVTFEPGARTAWHTHPAGQRLIVTAGAGWVQQWGGEIQEIRPGDVVSIPPGEKHWAWGHSDYRHDAHRHSGDCERKVVDWMEHVTDQQYRR
ncbi:MAG TPA: cupin domain-containing protein [Terriglobales bacterium]|nr:cupin domain-containing protein [Terriglobales bacterium]